MINTRTDAINFLKSQDGFNEAMAKVIVNECFNLAPNTDNDDKMRHPDGTIVQMEEKELRELYEHMILEEIDVEGDYITVLDERKYNLNGDIALMPTLEPEPVAAEGATGTAEQPAATDGAEKKENYE